MYYHLFLKLKALEIINWLFVSFYNRGLVPIIALKQLCLTLPMIYDRELNAVAWTTVTGFSFSGSVDSPKAFHLVDHNLLCAKLFDESSFSNSACINYLPEARLLSPFCWWRTIVSYFHKYSSKYDLQSVWSWSLEK